MTQMQIANTLGRAMFGELAYGLSIAAFGQVFIRFGTDRTLVRDLIHYPHIFAELIAASLLLRDALTAVTVVGLVAWKQLSAAPDVTWGLLLVIVANSVLSLDLQPAYEACTMQRHAVYFVLYKAVYFVMIWGIILFRPAAAEHSGDRSGRLGVGGVLHVRAASLGDAAAVDPARPSAAAPTDGVAGRAQFLGVPGHGLGLVHHGAQSTGAGKRRGALALGGYAAAMQLVLVGGLFLEQISRIGRPAVARYTRPGVAWNVRVRFLARYLTVMVLTVAPLAVAMVAAPQLILKVLLKPEYASSAPTMKILGGYVILYAIGLVASQYVISAGMDRVYMLSVSLGCGVRGSVCRAHSPLGIGRGGLGPGLPPRAAHRLLLVGGRTPRHKHLGGQCA